MNIMININPSCYSGEDCNNDFTNTTLGFSLVTCSVVATIIALKSSRRTTQFLPNQQARLFKCKWWSCWKGKMINFHR